MTSEIAPLSPASAPFQGCVSRCAASLGIAVLLPALIACQQRASADPPPPATVTATSALKAHTSSDGASAALQEEEPELRRGYGIVDMRFEPCVTAQGDQALRGEGCASGFVVYGPYVNVPAMSEIEVTFDVQPSQKVEVYADIVSQMGKQSLAGLNPQTIEAGATQRLGYRVHVADANQFVESRIGVRSPTPAGFSLSNYTMIVR